MKKYIFFLAINWVCLAVTAQTDSTSSIVIHKDPRIDVLIKKQIEFNEEATRSARRNISGYRLQVVNTNDREVALAAKTKIYKLFPQLKSYLIYQSPYFRLRVGNFKDKEEADEYLNALSREFPNNVFLVRDIIEIKLEKPDNN